MMGEAKFDRVWDKFWMWGEYGSKDFRLDIAEQAHPQV